MARGARTVQHAFAERRIWMVSRALSLPLGILLVLVCTQAGHSQSSSGNGSGSSQSGTSMRPPFSAHQDINTIAGDDYDPMMMARRMRALNIERQKEMVADANKLLKLARELNSEVAAQKSDALTPEQLRRVAEIEKLARSVKERMTSAVGEAQLTMPPPQIMYPLH